MVTFKNSKNGFLCHHHFSTLLGSISEDQVRTNFDSRGINIPMHRKCMELRQLQGIFIRNQDRKISVITIYHLGLLSTKYANQEGHFSRSGNIQKFQTNVPNDLNFCSFYWGMKSAHLANGSSGTMQKMH